MTASSRKGRWKVIIVLPPLSSSVNRLLRRRLHKKVKDKKLKKMLELQPPSR